jgi:hypothetical protein
MVRGLGTQPVGRREETVGVPHVIGARRLGQRRELMHDHLRLGLAHHPSHGIGIESVGDNRPRPQRPQPILLRRGPGHGHNLVASGHELGDQLSAQRTRSPGNENLHGNSPLGSVTSRDETAPPPVTAPRDRRRQPTVEIIPAWQPHQAAEPSRAHRHRPEPHRDHAGARCCRSGGRRTSRPRSSRSCCQRTILLRHRLGTEVGHAACGRSLRVGDGVDLQPIYSHRNELRRSHAYRHESEIPSSVTTKASISSLA